MEGKALTREQMKRVMGGEETGGPGDECYCITPGNQWLCISIGCAIDSEGFCLPPGPRNN